MYLCIERCCIGEMPFCYVCDKTRLHLCHKTADVRSLFWNGRIFDNADEHNQDLLSSLCEILTEQKTISQELIRQHEKLLQLFDGITAEAKLKKEQIRNERWHHPLYYCIHNYLSGRESLRETQAQYRTLLRSVDLHRHKKPLLGSLDQAVSIVEQVLRTDLGKTNKLLLKLKRIQ